MVAGPIHLPDVAADPAGVWPYWSASRRLGSFTPPDQHGVGPRSRAARTGSPSTARHQAARTRSEQSAPGPPAACGPRQAPPCHAWPSSAGPPAPARSRTPPTRTVQRTGPRPVGEPPATRARQERAHGPARPDAAESRAEVDQHTFHGMNRDPATAIAPSALLAVTVAPWPQRPRAITASARAGTLAPRGRTRRGCRARLRARRGAVRLALPSAFVQLAEDGSPSA